MSTMKILKTPKIVVTDEGRIEISDGHFEGDRDRDSIMSVFDSMLDQIRQRLAEPEKWLKTQ